MNNLILDTDIIIDVIRQNSVATDFFKTLQEVNISSFTALELVKGAQNKRNLHEINKRLKDFNLMYADEKSQKLGLEIYSQHHLTTGIGIIDSLIAGTTISNNMILVTKNIKHFKRISGIKVLAPYHISAEVI